MGKVIAFKVGVDKRAKATLREKQLTQENAGRGCISFTDTGNGTSQMKLTGTYANHLQFGIYAMVTGLKDLVDRVVESGDVGHHSADSIQEPLEIGRRPAGRQSLADPNEHI